MPLSIDYDNRHSAVSVLLGGAAFIHTALSGHANRDRSLAHMSPPCQVPYMTFIRETCESLGVEFYEVFLPGIPIDIQLQKTSPCTALARPAGLDFGATSVQNPVEAGARRAGPRHR